MPPCNLRLAQLFSFVPMLVNRVASGEHAAGNQHLIADFQRADFFAGEGKRKFRHGSHFNPNPPESLAN